MNLSPGGSLRLLLDSDVSRWPASLPHPALLFVGVAWGMNFVVLKLAYAEFEPATLALLRFLCMLPLLFLVARLMRSEVKVPREQWGRFALGGFLSSGVYMVLFMEGTSRVSPAQGAIMLATAPIWIGLFAILTRQEHFRWPLVWGLLAAYAGVTLVVLGDGKELGGSWLGITMTLGSAVVWAVSVIIMNPLLTERPAVGVFAKALPAAGLVLVPYGIQSMVSMDYSTVTPTGWFALSYLVLVAGVAAFVVYYIGVQAVGPAQAGMMQYIVPVVTVIGQFVVFGMALTWLQALGVAIVLFGVMMANRARQKEQKAKALAQAEEGIG